MPRYLTLEEQYKFLKSLAKQYEHVQLKVAITEDWENDDKNIAQKLRNINDDKNIAPYQLLGGGRHQDPREELQQRDLQRQHRRW